MRKIDRQDEIFIPSAPITAQNAPPAFRLDAVRSVRMHKQLACTVAAIVFVLVVGYALTRKPVYEAESLTYVEPLATKVMSDGSPGFYDPSRYDSYLEQQIQTVQRPDILAAAAAKLPEGTWRHEGESVAATATRLGAAIQVKRVGTSYQLSISATGSDAAGTAAAVNAVTNAYLEQGSKDEHAISDGRIQLLTEERDRIKNELLQAHTEQNTLSTSLGVANPVGEAGNPYDIQLAGLRTELAGAREAHDMAAAQLQSMSMHGNLHSAGLTAAANDSIAGDSGLSTMKASINQRRATLQSQMAGLTPSNPVYKLDQQEIAAMDRNLDTMTVQLRGKAEQNLQDKLRQELERTASVESKLNAQLAQDTARATGAAPKLQRAAEVAADITRLQAALAGVEDSLRALQLETQGPGMAHLSVAATPATEPAASRRGQLLLLAMPLALLAGIIAAVIARKRDHRAYTGFDLQHTLGFAPMAIMPAESEVSKAVMDEYLLRLASGIERASRANGARSFLFTAISVDTHIGNLVEELSGKLRDLGFSVGVIDVDDLMQANEERLTTSRRSAAVARLEQLVHGHDLLLIEARPLLFSAEAEYAACAADATILVAESGVTLCKELKDAANLLDRLHVKGVAAVLNDLHLAVADSRFVAAVEDLERSAYKQRRREARDRKAAAAMAADASTNPAPEPLRQGSSIIAVVQAPVSEAPILYAGPARVEQAPAVDRAVHLDAGLIVEPVVPIISQAPVAVAPVLQEQKVAEEAKIEKVVTASQPVRASAPRQSSMWDAEKYAEPPSFFDRIFKRFHEPTVSILPSFDDDDNEATDDKEVEATATAAPVTFAATAIAQPQEETPAQPSAAESAPARISAAYEVSEPVRHAVTVVDAPREPEPQELQSYREELAAALAHAAAKRYSQYEAPVVPKQAPSTERRYSMESQNVSREVAAERHAQAVGEVVAPASYSVPAAQFAAPASVAVMELEPLVQPQLNSEPDASAPAVQPTMRQWEFRQARTMRERAANDVRVADELGALRRSSRPGMVSTTGRRTLVEDAPAPVEAQPSRKWGMLSRFDQRFDAVDGAETVSQGKQGDREIAAYDALLDRGVRRD